MAYVGQQKQTHTLQLALSTILPFLVGLCATHVTLVAGDRFGWNTIPFVLVGWCLLLAISAGWLNQVVFGTKRTLFPFMIATGVILCVWLWQRLAFARLVPQSGLRYGYFLTPAGAKAAFWVLTCPFWVGFTCLLVSLITALVLGWRVGNRASLACVIPWWITAVLVFALPAMYLDAQGNASIFI